MQITDIRVRKTYDEGKMKAIVSVTFDDQFVIHDIKIIEGDNVYLLLCRAERCLMGNSKILHIL